MPAANQLSPDVAAAPVRIPKLAVRHRVPENKIVEQDGVPSEAPKDHAVRPPLSTHSSDRTISPTFERRYSDQSYKSQEFAERLKQKGNVNAAAKGTGKNATAKKKKGVLGFLTLKEPSTSAWEQYADAQRKAATQKTGRPGTAGLGVSSQKLPDNVPATNAKWEPEKEAKRISQASRGSGHRMSVISTSTRTTSRSGGSSSGGSIASTPARKYGSISSRPSNCSIPSPPASKHGSAQPVVSAGDVRRPIVYNVASPTTLRPALRDNAVTPWDEPEVAPSSQVVPAIRTSASRDKAVTPWDEPLETPSSEQFRPRPDDGKGSPQTFLHPPSPPLGRAELSAQLPTPELELSEILAVGVHDSRLTSPEPSPLTPPAGLQDELSKPSVGESSYLRLGGHSGDESGTFWHSDTDNEAELPRSTKLSSGKAPPNFSRPWRRGVELPVKDEDLPVEPIFEEEDEVETLQPTLRDEKGRTSPFILEQPPAQHRHRSSLASSHTPFNLVSRMDSTSSRLTNMTATTATTFAQALHSPTFSVDPSDLTRPSTAASEVSTETASTAHKRTSLSPIRSNSDTVSVAPSERSMAPSEMSMQWRMTPKERLGLGGRVIRRDASGDVMPWEADEKPATAMSAKRQSGISQSKDDSKLKRLSMRLGRR